MKRTNNGPILSALILAQAFFFPVDNRKRNKNPWLKTKLTKWLEMIKMNTVALLLPVIPGRKCNKIASAF